MLSWILMLTWHELLKYHHCPPEIFPQRTPQIEQKYVDFRRNNPEIIATLRQRFFKSEQIVLVLSDFPYDIEANILHYILWISDDNVYSHQQIETAISQRHLSVLPGVNMICYQNPPHRRTINEIQHYHVFIRDK